MENIDANIIGKSGYVLLQKQGVIPNKMPDKLTGAEAKEITDKLIANTKMNLEVFSTTVDKADRERSIFMTILFSNVIALINNVDINNYISMKPNI